MARPRMMKVKRREIHSSDEMDFNSAAVGTSRVGKRMRHSILPPIPVVLQSMSQQRAHRSGPPPIRASVNLTQPQTARPSVNHFLHQPATTIHLSDSESSDSDQAVSQSSTSESESNADEYMDAGSELPPQFREATRKESPGPAKPTPSSASKSRQPPPRDLTPTRNLPSSRHHQPSPPNQLSSRRNQSSPQNQPSSPVKIYTDSSTNTVSPISNNVNNQLLTDALMNLHSYMDKLMDSHKDFIEAVKLGFENMHLVLEKI